MLVYWSAYNYYFIKKEEVKLTLWLSVKHSISTSKLSCWPFSLFLDNRLANPNYCCLLAIDLLPSVIIIIIPVKYTKCLLLITECIHTRMKPTTFADSVSYSAIM